MASEALRRELFLKNAAALAEIAYEHPENPIYVTYAEGHIAFEAPAALSDSVMATFLSVNPQLVVNDHADDGPTLLCPE